MSVEISARTVYPYSAIMFIITTFPDGTRAAATGAVVGRNDVLTATHALYNPSRGGWATKVEIFPGADYNMTTGRFENTPYNVGAYTWRAAGWPNQAFADGDNQTFTYSETQYDVAVIGLSVPIGDQVGWFGLDAGRNAAQWAQMVGYPSDSTGMMLGTAWVERDAYHSMYTAAANGTNDLMGPGSSGGPLFIVGADGNPYIIGVKSSGSATSNHWADIGFLYDQIVGYINSNNDLLPTASSTPPASNLIGTSGNDTFTAGAGNDAIEGGAGLDAAIYSGMRSYFAITKTGASYTVTAKIGPGGTDTIVNIERLIFTDAALALDIDGNAGKAYRLYQAAFDRQPDVTGLGFWIKALDGGTTLQSVASAFVTSTEFQTLYGANLTDGALLTAVYGNVLHRTPDQSGYNWWMGALASGNLTRSQLLIDFSESAENKLQVIGSIQNGIDYVPWVS